MALHSRLTMCHRHSLTLRDGTIIRLCDLRTRFRLDQNNIYTHFSLEDVKKYNLRVQTETYTSVFPRIALENCENFYSLFRSFCKWASRDEPILLHEEGAFLVDAKYPKRIKGIAISVWVPVMEHKDTMEMWACRCLLKCNRQLLSIANLKRYTLRRALKMSDKEFAEEMETLVYWEAICNREIRLIKAMGDFGQFVQTLDKDPDILIKRILKEQL